MKNLNNIWFAVFASAILLVGCNDESKEAMPDNGTAKVNISLSVVKPPVQEDETRLHLDGDKNTGFISVWDENEAIGVFTTCDSGNRIETSNARFTYLDQENGVARFDGGSLNVEAGSSYNHNFYAYYPYTDAGDSCTYNALNHSIPTIQTLLSGGMYDPAAEFMVATPVTKELDENDITGFVIDDMQFNRKVTMINLCAGTNYAAWGSDIMQLIAEGEKIERVSFVAPSGTMLTGNFSINLANPADGLNFSDGVNHVEGSLPVSQEFDEFNVWLLTAPFVLNSGTSFNVTMVTQNYTITRTVTVNNSITLKESGVKVIALNFVNGYTITPNTPSQQWVEIFCEEFTGLTGNNTVTTGSSTAWTGNDNFPTVSTCYQGGDAVRVGKSAATGYLTTVSLDLSSPFRITLTAKAWINKSTGDIKITAGSQEQTMSFGTDFETKTIEFQAATDNSTINIETVRVSDNRIFIDDVKVEAFR